LTNPGAASSAPGRNMREMIRDLRARPNTMDLNKIGPSGFVWQFGQGKYPQREGVREIFVTRNMSAARWFFVSH
jgi:hypothetical protein